MSDHFIENITNINMKHRLAKMDASVQLFDILDQLSMLAYGHKHSHIYGKSQQCKIKAPMKLIINIPQAAWDNSQYMRVAPIADRAWAGSKPSIPIQVDIRNIADHASASGVDVKINFV
jgi:hypothetical protein